MIGVIVLIVVVVAVAVGGVLLAARDAGRSRQARGASERVRQALAAPSPAERRRAVEDLARHAATAAPAEAAALVLACRRAFSRDVIPIFGSALGHPDARVVDDAARALADSGAPGLRAAWVALAAAPQPPAAVRAFLLAHPDWLFERLLEDFVAAGPASVERHATLWREGGLVARLRLMRSSDAVGAIRAREIGRLLGIALDSDADSDQNTRPKAG